VKRLLKKKSQTILEKIKELLKSRETIEIIKIKKDRITRVKEGRITKDNRTKKIKTIKTRSTTTQKEMQRSMVIILTV